LNTLVYAKFDIACVNNYAITMSPISHISIQWQSNL